ncbi:MAG: GMC oxidoreductase [Gammaproteobacteria bacterium]
MYKRVRWSDTRLHEGDLNPDLPVFIAKAVGGTSIIWAGIALRLQAHEFQARTTYGDVAGTSLADWPVDAATMAPWYDRAEQRMGVTGRHGNPFLPDHNNALLLKVGAKRIGFTDVSNGHVAVNASAHDGRPACRQFGFCASGCVIGAKWSAMHAEIPLALASGRYELREHSMVVGIEHDTAGHASAVVYVDAEGRRQRQRARVVCVAANGIETPRLLLLSASGKFPTGLANGSGLVGHNYMTDLLGRVIAIMPGRVDNYRGTSSGGALVADDMRNDPSRGFVGGYLLAPRGIHLSTYVNEPDPAGWGQDYAEIMEAYPNMATSALLGEDMPVHDNRVALHSDTLDQYGNPVPVIHKRFHANDHALMKYGLARGEEIYRALGAERVFTRPSTVAIHNLGTCRMSADPATGVCDAFGRSHEVPNLYISDGSQFVSSGAAPPTLTIVALALRQAAAIVQDLRSGQL